MSALRAQAPDLLPTYLEIAGRSLPIAEAKGGASTEKLAALKRDEVKVARADLACEKREITPVELEVRPQYEASFRDRNRRLISQVRPVGG